MSKLRFAIVGCGVIHGTHIEAIKKLSDDAELVAVCDEIGERAKTTAEKEGVAAFTDLATMLRDVEFDVLTVCTPSGLHAKCGVMGANAGKHIVCEKPIDVSLEAADALINACEKNNVKLVVISQHRYSQGIRQLKGYLEAGRLGTLCYSEAVTKWYRTQEYYDSGGWRGTWELDGGGALMNQGVHYVDQFLYCMGPVKSVTAAMNTRAHERIEVEDTVTASVVFESGAIGTLTASTAMFPGYRQGLEVYGTGGTVIVEKDRIRHAQFQTGEEARSPGGVKASVPEVKDFIAAETAPAGENSGEAKSEGASDPRAISTNGHVEHLKDLIGAIREDRQTFMHGREARKALELIVAVYRAAKTGERVHLPL